MSGARYRRRDVELHEVEPGGEAIVHDPGGGRLIVLNPVGAAVFDLLDDAPDIDAIAASLAEVFSLDPEVARRDAERFLDALVASGVAERLPPA